MATSVLSDIVSGHETLNETIHKLVFEFLREHVTYELLEPHDNFYPQHFNLIWWNKFSSSKIAIFVPLERLVSCFSSI